MNKKHPRQKIHLVKDGVPRFVQNDIVLWLLEAGPYDLNQIACLPNVDWEDREQFAQLIGYSVSGFGDLSYADVDTVTLADSDARRLLQEEKNKNAAKE